MIERESSFYIDGQWQEFRDVARLPVIDPTSEMVTGQIAAGGARHVDIAAAAARKAFPTFSQMPVPERISLLGRMHSLLKERAEAFAQDSVANFSLGLQPD